MLSRCQVPIKNMLSSLTSCVCYNICKGRLWLIGVFLTVHIMDYHLLLTNCIARAFSSQTKAHYVHFIQLGLACLSVCDRVSLVVRKPHMPNTAMQTPRACTGNFVLFLLLLNLISISLEQYSAIDKVNYA